MKYLTNFMLLLCFTNQVISQEVQLSEISNCGLSEPAIKLAQLIIESENQQRSELKCNKKLSEIALVKAKMMAKASRISHNIDHTTPNELLRQHGIKLPKNYGFFDNQVESIMGAVATPQKSFDVFMTSPGHKYHLLGEDKFLHKQNQIGVGYYKDTDSEHVYHWVVYITQILPNKKYSTKLSSKHLY